jgi:hypothetical protein
MTMQRNAIVLSLCLVALVATEARADSIFGLSFFGPDVSTLDGRTEGRAGVGIAYRDSMNSAVSSPTQLVDLRRVTVGMSTAYDRRWSEDEFGSIVRSSISTPTLRMGFPFWGGRGGIGIGYQAQRATQWQIVRAFPGTDDVIEVIEREGTLFTIPLQVALRLHEKVVVAGGLHLERGTIRMRYLLDLPSGGIDPVEVREDIYRSTAPEFAVAIQDIGPLSLGGYYVAQHDADVDINQEGIALSNREEADRTDTLPARFGVGARYDLPGRWSVGVDFGRQQWSDYEGRSFRYDDEGAFSATGTNDYELVDEDTWRFGLEYEAIPLGFRQSTPWRFGAYSRTWHYPLRGNDLTEWGVTVGTGIALRAGWARTDLAFGYSRIGNLEDNGAKEDLFRIVLSIAGGERWY